MSSGIAAIEHRWRELAVERGNPFAAPEWFRCWLEHYGEGSVPLVATLGQGGEVKGVMALAISRSGRPRRAGIAGASLGDRFHPACAPEHEMELARVAGRAVADADEEWSVLALLHVEEETPWVRALADATGLRLTMLRRRAGGLPMVDMRAHSSWDEYLAGRSRNLRGQIGNLTRRCEREHALRVRRTEEPSEVSRDVATLFDLHSMRFGGRSSIDERARAFHADFAALALGRGWLRLWFLELDGRPVAAWYGWRLGPRYTYFNGGFDPGWSRRRPGLVLQAKVMESAFGEGAAEFDFLIGDEPYKHRFADRTREVFDVTLARAFPHPAGALARTEYAARNVGRRIPISLRTRLGMDRLGDRAPLTGASR